MKKKTKFKKFILIIVGVIAVSSYLAYVYPLRLIETYSHTQENPPRYFHVEKQGDNLYVFSRFEELLVFDISDPKEIELKELIEFPFNLDKASEISLQGDYVYIVAQKSELIVVDISRLETPRVVARYFPPETYSFISKNLIEENVAYVAEVITSPYYRLHILDVSDPLAIKENSQLDRAGIPLEVVQGKYLYLDAANSIFEQSILGNLKIVDVSDPANPQVINDLKNYRGVWDVEAHGNHLYIAANGQFLVTEISDPVNPLEVGILNRNIFIEELIPVEDYVYFLSAFRVGVIDVSDPNDPILLGYRKLRQGKDFTVSERYVYVADSFGLYVYKTGFIANPLLKIIENIKTPLFAFVGTRVLPFIFPSGLP